MGLKAARRAPQFSKRCVFRQSFPFASSRHAVWQELFFPSGTPLQTQNGHTGSRLALPFHCRGCD